MKTDIIRAWKDREYRESLSAEELALLPENPVGMVELTDDDLMSVVGGGGGGGGTQTCCQNLSVCLNSVLCTILCG